MSKVGPRIVKNLNFLKLLAKTKSPAKRSKTLQSASVDEILSIVEVCYNILKSRFQLTSRQRYRILPHVEFVRCLGRARSEKRARSIIQRGSGMSGAVSSILIPVVAELIRTMKSAQ